jgi:alpha-beta hydrolase superfamily lysophospholipase
MMDGLQETSVRLRTADGLELHVRRFDASQGAPRSTFVVAHGHGEHSGRYRAFAAWFAARGVRLYAIDHRGHGLSGGPRGHTPSLQAMLDDLDQVVTLAAQDRAGPVTLVGHSLGGLIAIAYALDRPQRLETAVFSAPALKLRVRVPGWKRALARLTPAVAPRLTMPTGLDPAGLSRDARVADAYVGDPLVHDRISTRFNAETFARGEQLIARASELRVPFLLLQGGSDPIVDPDGAHRFFERAQAPGRALKVYPDLYHEIFNEPEQDQVFQDIVDWLAEERARVGAGWNPAT